MRKKWKKIIKNVQKQKKQRENNFKKNAGDGI